MKALMDNENNKNMLGLKKPMVKKIHSAVNAGFTLMELLVVLGIFAVVMGVALFNQTGLNSSILITNLAYETALAVREAQTYGISVRATATTTANLSTAIFDKGYGVFFDTMAMNQVVVFGDSNGDGFADIDPQPGEVSEIQSLYEIKNQRGNNITSICVGNLVTEANGLAIRPCNIVGANDHRLGDGQKLSIMFKRPNPESNFYVFDQVGDPVGGGTFPSGGPAVIVVNNLENSNCRAIIVEVTGQIRVENSTGGNCVNGGQ